MRRHYPSSECRELAGLSVYGLAAFLLPSFIRPSGDGATKFRQKRLGVSSLDGLRGFAAVAVMNYHILYAYLPAVFYGYGLPQAAAEQCARAEDRENHNLWLYQLSLLRLPYTGTWPISVFFVISGFSLSYRTHWESYHTDGGVANGTMAMASSLLRRPIRLYGPPIIASMITMIAIYLGAYEPGREVSNNSHWIPVFQELHHRRFNTLGGQVLDWCHETWKMLNIFWWGDLYNKYDVHLWTIPVEFRCLLAVFLVLPAYITIRPWMRRFIILILVFYVYTLDRWDVSLFFSGLSIADTSISLEASIDSSFSFSNFRLKLFQAARMTMLGFSLLLLSAPDFCMGDTPGFILLSRMIPHSDPAPFRFLPNLGGLLLVALLAHAPSSDPVISTALRSSIAQYFRRISHSIYIVHGPLIHTVGYAIFPFFWYVTGLVAAYLVVVAIVIWVADVFWRAVDKPCLRSAKSLQRYLVVT
ncbi:acyltransferase 3 [Xylariaceae sp. FL1651]|nr:acyltransferase 3 [Xylariaceae sp. FL1651]